MSQSTKDTNLTTTRIPKGRTRIAITIDDDVLAAVQKIADEMDVPKSRIFEACIDSGLDDMDFFSFIGLPPRRFAALVRTFKRLKRWRSGNVEVDFERAAEQMEVLGKE